MAKYVILHHFYVSLLQKYKKYKNTRLERKGDRVRGDSVVGLSFGLPDEILSVIPMDPYEQLDLAQKITSMALALRMLKLKSKVGHMQQWLHEKD